MKCSELCISPEKSIRQAMRQLDDTAKKILFVVENGRLVATLTDGDVRRHLLRGGQMEDSVVAAGNLHPRVAECRAEAKTLLKNNGLILTAVPVVSKNGALLDVVLQSADQSDSFPHLGIPVVIQAGGKGKRLDPYTRVLPKPLIPVGELPIIEHIMRQFAQYDCHDFHVIVNYKKQLMKAYFAENERQYQLNWYDEEQPLGTGGGLCMLKGKINSTFFLTNCDILLRSDYDALLRFHRENGNVVTMVGAYKNLQIPYGVIEIGENGIIQGMCEKPELSFLTNTGVYLVEPEVLEDIEDGVAIGFPDIIELQRKKGRRTAVFPVSEGQWLDMGQMDELESMRKTLYGE